jgi:hypothetical protein
MLFLNNTKLWASEAAGNIGFENKQAQIKNFSSVLLSDKNQSSKYIAQEIGAVFLSFPFLKMSLITASRQITYVKHATKLYLCQRIVSFIHDRRQRSQLSF